LKPKIQNPHKLKLAATRKLNQKFYELSTKPFRLFLQAKIDNGLSEKKGNLFKA
jgi:hypothetical protein